MSYTNLLGLWPHDAPRPTKSEAERKIYDALKTSLPKGWYAWHSLRLRTNTKGEFSEADFIIAEPDRPSLLILEVKGGQISQQDGHWYQNKLPLKEPPLDQAFNFRRQLIDRFKEDNIDSPTIGVAACFPDTFFSQQPTQNDLQGLVIGAHASHPFNPNVANVFFRSGEIESWGRGIERIFSACRKMDSPLPRIQLHGHDLWIEFPFSPQYLAAIKGLTADEKSKVHNTTQETTQEKIILLLKDKPSLTRRELAQQLELSEDGIKYHLQNLKKQGRIRHVGPTKKGHWEVLD